MLLQVALNKERTGQMIKQTVHFDEITVPNSFFRSKEVTLRRTPFMFYRTACILFLALLCLKNSAQEIDEKNFTLYTKLDGLSQNYVNSIVQDSTGYIWIATNKGLNRFDGKTFINFFKNSENSPLPDNSVVLLRIQNNNEIIGSTIGGAFSFNTVTGQHKKFFVPADPIFYQWANRIFDALKDIKGNYVVSTKTGLYVFNDKGKIICRYDHHLPTDAGRTELWFGNWLQTLDNGIIFQQNGLSGSAYYPEQNRIDTFYTAKKLRLLGHVSPLKGGDTSSSFSGYRNEMFFVDPGESSIELINVSTNSIFTTVFPGEIISDFNWQSRSFFINDSSIAVTSKIGGFYIFNYYQRKKRITGISKKYFASKYCTSIFKDRDGRLWIGTNDGLYRQNLRNPFFTTDDLSLQFPGIVNTGIQSLYSENEKLFIGLRNEGGLLLLNKKTNKIDRHISFENLGKGSNTIIYVFPYHPDTLWLGTNNNVIWLNKKNFSSGTLSNIEGQPAWMKNERCRNYMQDSRGNIWLSFGRLNSVLMFDRHQYKFTEIISPLLKITFCFSMIEDKQGNVWLAGDGFCRWNFKKKSVDTLIPYPSVRRSQYNFIELLDVDETNKLWISSAENEIIQYNLEKNHMTLRLQENNMLDGYLVANSPIINDQIWMCLANGISAFNVKNYSVKQFNYADGLPNAVATSIRKGSFYDQHENLFYFGAGPYLISFTPDVSLPHTQSIPNFFIEVISGNGKVTPQTNEIIHLPYFQNNLQLRFNVINFTDPEDNRYSYRIRDEDSAWHDLNTQSTIGLNNLASGNYYIEVKLSSVNNRWPEQVKDLRIAIVPPFWKTQWFLITAIVLLLALLYLFYRFRIRQIRQKANLDKVVAQTEMKALHAQMNPHFIFNCLNSIREMILNNENKQASHYLNKFAQLIRITLDQSSKPFVSLQNTIDYLQLYIEMERIRTSNFTHSIEVDRSLRQEDILLPPMLIQPFVENSIWHGVTSRDKPMKIDIRFQKDHQQLLCVIEDDGIGIETSLKKKQTQLGHDSFGIENIRQRIRVLNEKYNLQSTITIEDKYNLTPMNGTGTIVKLRLPIKNTTL